MERSQGLITTLSPVFQDLGITPGSFVLYIQGMGFLLKSKQAKLFLALAGLLALWMFSVVVSHFPSCKNSFQQAAPDRETVRYNAAIKMLGEDPEDGLLEIYRIASKSASAEISEIARDELCSQLYQKPELWVKTFSKVEPSEFEKYLDQGGLSPIDFPAGIDSQRKFSEVVRGKLKTIRWSSQTRVFADMISLKLKASLNIDPQSAPVAEVLEKRLDATGDGVSDVVTLKISGAAWDRPFKWTLSITSAGKLVYQHFSDDAWLDRFFYDKGYVDDECRDYLACKKEYYLEDILGHIVSQDDLGKRQVAAGDWSEIRKVAQDDLKAKFGLSAAEASQTADLVMEHLKSRKVVLLHVPKSPVQSEAPKVYVPRVGGFVAISDEM